MTWTRLPNIFHDPAGRRSDYHWTINHSDETEVPRSYQMGNGAPTGNIGLLPQQGQPLPIVFQWKGTALTQEQVTELQQWFTLCGGGIPGAPAQSIYLTDFMGEEFEVLITDLGITRKGVAWNRRGGVPLIWEYTISMRVLSIISSATFAGATP